MKAHCLDSLFPDVGHDAFMEKYYLKEHVVQHGDPLRLPAFLAPDGPLADFARARELATEFDVAYEAEEAYIQHRGSGSAKMFYDLGATVRFTSLDRRVPTARSWLHKLCKELGMPMRSDESYDATLNGWASKQSKGVAYHYDTQEVILVQLVGRKRFMVAKNDHTRFPDIPYQYDRNVSLDLFPLFANGFPEGKPQNGTEIELGPGSAIFMPRGTWHSSEALDGDSFAVAIVLEAPSTLDVCLSYLRQRLRCHPEWRQPLHVFQNSALRKEETERLAGLLRRLEQDVKEIDAPAVLRHASKVGREKIRPTSKCAFQVSPSVRMETSEGPDGLVVEVRGHSPRTSFGDGAVKHIEAAVEIDEAFAPAIQWLSGRRAAFTLDDISAALPRIARADLSALLAQLAELYVIVVMPFSAPASAHAS